MGRRIEKARVEAGVRSSAEIARNVGVSEASMSAYVRGRQKPSPDILSRIASFLQVTPQYLEGADDQPGNISAAAVFPFDKAFPPDRDQPIQPMRLPISYQSKLGEADPVALAEIQSAINRLCRWRGRKLDAEQLVRLAIRIHDEILEGLEKGGRESGA